MKEIVVVGSGGHAKVVIEILEILGKYKIIGIIDKEMKEGNTLCGYPVLGNDDILPVLFKKGITHAALGVGGYIDNVWRKKIFLKIKSAGFNIVSAVHPSCTIMPSVSLGEGVVMYPGVAINSYAKIADNVICGTGATVDHETVVESHVLISAGVTVGAYAKIREECLLAIGATIVSGVTVGKSSLVAAGAVVLKDAPDNSRVAGVPAKTF